MMYTSSGHTLFDARCIIRLVLVQPVAIPGPDFFCSKIISLTRASEGDKLLILLAAVKDISKIPFTLFQFFRILFPNSQMPGRDWSYW